MPKHIVIPAIGTIALAVVVYYSVNPLPAWPVGLAPFIVLGLAGGRHDRRLHRVPGNRAGDLKLAGVAMGEAVEHAIEERLVAPGELPPPSDER